MLNKASRMSRSDIARLCDEIELKIVKHTQMSVRIPRGRIFYVAVAELVVVTAASADRVRRALPDASVTETGDGHLVVKLAVRSKK